jgi:uncharacterized protein YigE (DUF2233 family)
MTSVLIKIATNSLLLLLLLANSARSEIPGTGIAFHEITFTSNGRPSFVRLLVFNPETCSLQVIDNGPNHKSPRHKNLQEALTTLECIAGINGGFFDLSNFTPEGLIIASGIRTGTISNKDWLAGFLVVDSGTVKLQHRRDFKDSPSISNLLQSGPWLVLNSLAVTAINHDDTPVRRSFIASAADGRVALGYCDRSSLHELAEILVAPNSQKIFPANRVLNLDGGPSTAMVSLDPSNPISFHEMWTVRNFIGITRKKPR